MNGSSLLPLQSQLFIPNASFTHTSASLHFLSQRSISKPQKHADCSRKGHLLSYSWAYNGWMDEFRNSWNFSKVSSSSTQFCSTAALNKVSMIRKKKFFLGVIIKPLSSHFTNFLSVSVVVRFVLTCCTKKVCLIVSIGETRHSMSLLLCSEFISDLNCL